MRRLWSAATKATVTLFPPDANKKSRIPKKLSVFHMVFLSQGDGGQFRSSDRERTAAAGTRGFCLFARRGGETAEKRRSELARTALRPPGRGEIRRNRRRRAFDRHRSVRCRRARRASAKEASAPCVPGSRKLRAREAFGPFARQRSRVAAQADSARNASFPPQKTPPMRFCLAGARRKSFSLLSAMQKSC